MKGFSTLLERAFGHPRGLLGGLGGAVMARGNAATEQQLVRQADLGEDDAVLVLGPGPGVGLRAAGERAAQVVGVEPAPRMRRAATARCRDLVQQRRVELRAGEAERTGVPSESFDAVLSVNNLQLWRDRGKALHEVYRALRPGGRLLLSAHERWLPGGRDGLRTDVTGAGFEDVRSWTWEPPGRWASTAAQLRAWRPSE